MFRIMRQPKGRSRASAACAVGAGQPDPSGTSPSNLGNGGGGTPDRTGKRARPGAGDESRTRAHSLGGGGAHPGTWPRNWAYTTTGRGSMSGVNWCVYGCAYAESTPLRDRRSRPLPRRSWQSPRQSRKGLAMLDLGGTRLRAVTAVACGILMLTACEHSSGAHARSGAASSSPSTNASVPADSPSLVPASTTPSATPGAPAGAATSPTPTGTAASASADRAGCHNLTATDEVKAAVTAAYQRSFPRFAHIRPVPRQFFHGQCGGVRYAATRFESTPVPRTSNS